MSTTFRASLGCLCCSLVAYPYQNVPAKAMASLWKHNPSPKLTTLFHTRSLPSVHTTFIRPSLHAYSGLVSRACQPFHRGIFCCCCIDHLLISSMITPCFLCSPGKQGWHIRCLQIMCCCSVLIDRCVCTTRLRVSAYGSNAACL